MTERKRYATGGKVRGTGGPTDDTVPAWLYGCTLHGHPHPRRLIREADGSIQCNGEWVIRPSAVLDEHLLDQYNH